VVITDTVGFLKDLPKDLLGAFRATLDEMQDADLIIHVVDISNPRFEQQMESVEKLFIEIGLDRIPKLVVFNKVDLVNQIWAKAIAARFHGVTCSAIDRNTFDSLMIEIENRVWPGEKPELIDNILDDGSGSNLHDQQMVRVDRT